MIKSTLANFLKAVFIQRKVLLIIGGFILWGLIRSNWAIAIVYPIAAALGAMYKQKMLYRLEIEEDSIVLFLMRLRFPFKLEQVETWHPIGQIHKVEYLPKEDHGQVHILLKNSRKPSREYAVVPSPYWTERSEAIYVAAQATSKQPTGFTSK